MIDRYRRARQHDPLVEVVRDLIHEIGYQQEIARLYPEAADQETAGRPWKKSSTPSGSYAKRAKEPTIGRLSCKTLP